MGTAAQAPTPVARTARLAWRLAMLAAVLWVGWELNGLRHELAAPAPAPIGVSQQVAEMKAELDQMADAVSQLQDAMDRVEAALSDETEADAEIRRDTAFQQRVAQPRRRHAAPAAHQGANTSSSSAIQRRLSASPAKLASKLLRASV
jgi:hypothetical protein